MCDFLDLTCCDAEKKRVCSERTENQHPTTVEVKHLHHKTLDLVGWFHGLEQWQEMATKDLPEVFFSNGSWHSGLETHAMLIDLLKIR